MYVEPILRYIYYRATRKNSFAKAANKMRRRTKSVGGSAKTRLRRTAKQKRHGSKAQRRRVSRTFRRDTEIDSLTREMSTIAEQQRATTEVLKLIGSSSRSPRSFCQHIGECCSDLRCRHRH